MLLSQVIPFYLCDYPCHTSRFLTWSSSIHNARRSYKIYQLTCSYPTYILIVNQTRIIGKSPAMPNILLPPSRIPTVNRNSSDNKCSDKYLPSQHSIMFLTHLFLYSFFLQWSSYLCYEISYQYYLVVLYLLSYCFTFTLVYCYLILHYSYTPIPITLLVYPLSANNTLPNTTDITSITPSVVLLF